jgi:hypothetical protein
MAKIGVLIFTDKVKERLLSNDVFDSKKYFGLNAIIQDLDKTHSIDYCSTYTCDNFDFVLISIISYYDALNYINEIAFKKHTCKFIVGGPYVLNYMTFINAYAVCIGRGEGLINKIIDHEKIENVHYFDDCQTNLYKYGGLKRFLCVGTKNEASVGCKAKCFFCQYAWKQKYVSEKTEGYNSGYSTYEDYIQSIVLEKNGRYVTAIDGSTERSRYIVNKKIKDDDIRNKLLEAKNNDIAGMLKIYNIIAYPWEKTVDINPFIEIVKGVDLNSNSNKNKITIYLTHTHFVPKLHTPLEDFKVNLIDARKYIVSNPIPFNGKYFKVSNNISITSNSTALEEYIIDRADEEDDIMLIHRIICSNKYKSLNNSLKLKTLLKYFDKFANGYYPSINVEKSHNIDALKKRLKFM